SGEQRDTVGDVLEADDLARGRHGDSRFFGDCESAGSGGAERRAERADRSGICPATGSTGGIAGSTESDQRLVVAGESRRTADARTGIESDQRPDGAAGTGVAAIR